MADIRPPLPSQNSGSFADGRPQVHFGRSASPSFPATGLSMPSPFDSQTHLASEPGQDYDDDYIEKLPLNDGQNFGGFYPPPCAQISLFLLDILSLSCRPIPPGAYDDSYVPKRPGSVVSTSTNGIESAWRRRQTIKRGKTRKVKLTNGNFIAEYPVPTPVFSAMEERWTSASTTEFS
jgi:chitin synthase